MPLNVSVQDPFSTNTLSNCWAYCSLFQMDFANHRGKLTYAIHADKASAYANKPPIKVVEFEITTAGTVTVPSFDTLLGQNQAAYASLLASVDTLALAQPFFAEATIEVAQ